MKNKIILTIIQLTISSSMYVKGQSSTINPYFPLDSRTKYFLGEDGDTLISKILQTDKIIDGTKYFVQELRWRNGSSQLYYRIQDGNIIETQDSIAEYTFLPFHVYIGQEWFLVQKRWKYKVIDKNARLTIGNTKYKKLLKIQEYDLEIPTDTAIYFSYYKRGLGLLARTRNEKMEMSFLKYD